MFPKQSQVDNFYGNPRGRNGQPSAAWEKANLVIVPTPWAAVAAWDLTLKIRGVRTHRKCAESLARVFNKIWIASGKSQTQIEKWGMHLLGGGYNFRLIRGGSSLSMHSWGCAVDFDPARNGLHDDTPHFAHCPEVLKAFASEGWTWGGNWTRADGMHWQAASV
ncbi:MAG: M15 family metallopeptidase [Culicoidibacterales bacterium]